MIKVNQSKSTSIILLIVLIGAIIVGCAGNTSQSEMLQSDNSQIELSASLITSNPENELSDVASAEKSAASTEIAGTTNEALKDESVLENSTVSDEDGTANASEDKTVEVQIVDPDDEDFVYIDDETLTPTQLTSIAMLNYMTVLTQKINTSKGNQMFLESARTALYNDTNLKAVDTKTQTEIKNLVDTIDKYRMIDVKRQRLEFIYEQNKAQALRQAIPNPMGLLSVVESGSLLKAAASVVYMAVDSATSYQSATNQAELQFIKEGWELDDEETKLLQNSTTEQFDYMCNMVRDYDLPDEYVVRDADVKAFVDWSDKTNLIQKIGWLKTNENTYQKFGPYWLELVKDYYEAEEYENCLDAIAQYESISAKITRKDGEYANVLPMVVIALKETLSKDKYTEEARAYCKAIVKNTKDEDWTLRYFAAQIYLDIYKQTKKDADLKSAYDIAYYNVTTLIDAQRELNKAYIAPIVDVKPESGATKRQKSEIKQYNKLLKAERKVAVPPVSEALYLNCDLLFALAEKKGITSTERERIEKLLHENGTDLFLTKSLDNKFRLKGAEIVSDDIEVSFDGGVIEIPALCISDRSQISVSVNDNDVVIEDWLVTEVDRPKGSVEIGEYIVEFNSKISKKYDYQAGDIVKINVTPIIESPDETIAFTFEVIPTKILFVFDGVAFERK